MILNQIRYLNIKSFYPEEKIHLDEGINLFVGPNAGGKSNLFEVTQGVISNLLLKHITIQVNQNRNAVGHADRAKPYQLSPDNVDQSNISQNILDKHFKHIDKPCAIYLHLLLTLSDIEIAKTIISKKDSIIKFLADNVSGSQDLVQVLEIWKDYDFSTFIGKELIAGVIPGDSPAIQILDYTNFPTNEKQISLNQLFEIIQYINVIHELSTVYPEIDISPITRYFPPQRNLTQPQENVFVDMNSIGNFEDSYSKSTNLNKDSSFSFIDSSVYKLCYLYEDKKKERIAKYKYYLRKYLKVTFAIVPLKKMRFKKEYEIRYKRINGLPMRLSSGEKEFFNLITGLILSGIENGVVFIDEPELHLHFQWQQIVLNLISELSQEFNIQFLMVTHSPKLVNQITISHLQRVNKKGLYSRVIKPVNDIGKTVADKDLIQFLTTTNNEKAFFTNKVVLVEGPSDLIIITKIIDVIKMDLRSETEVEVLQVSSKSNLMKFRQFLNNWEIENIIIADFDFIIDIKKNKDLFIESTYVRNMLIDLDTEITNTIKFSERKLREVLCNNSKDSRSMLELIKNKHSYKKEEFLKEIDQLTDYIVNERALSIDKTVMPADSLNKLFDTLSKKEKVFLLRRGDIEVYFPTLHANKVENALAIANTLDIASIDSEFIDYIKMLLK